MKKILIISQNFYPEIGSAGNRIKNVYTLLRKHQYNVEILTTEPTYPTRSIYENKDFWDDSALNDDVNIHRIHIRNRKYSRSIFNRLIYYIEMLVRMVFFILTTSRKYDVVFVTSPPIFVALVGVIAKWKFKAKFILDIRDLWPESLRGVNVFNHKYIIAFFNIIEYYLYKSANSIIINSLGFKQHLIENRKVDSNKISYLPNSAMNFELKVNVDKEEGKSKGFKVIYAGNIGLAQDSDLLLQIAEELNRHEIELTIIGYGINRKRLFSKLKDHNLENINLIKPTTRRECLVAIASHDAGIVTLNDSKVFETVLPGKIVDYMISGVPIVASVSGLSKRVIEREQVGYVVNNRNSKELVDYILKLKENTQIAKQMSANAFNYIKKHHLWEENIEVLINQIERSSIDSSLSHKPTEKNKVKII